MNKIAMILLALTLGCATAPRVRPCNDDTVGLSSEVVGWEGPPPVVPGAPRQVRITAHNGSDRPVRFVMECGLEGGSTTQVKVGLDEHEEHDFFFTVMPSRDRRTVFGCDIVKFGLNSW